MMKQLLWNKLPVMLVLSIIGYVAMNIGSCDKVTFWNIVNPYKLGGIFLQILLGNVNCQYVPFAPIPKDPPLGE